jgi:DNA-binding CsgD family transcriptional regulator
MAKRVLAAGAQAFLTTGSIQGELAATVDRLVGRPGRSQGRSPRASAGTGAAILTEREVEVLRSVAAGHTNRQIAALMAISDETVKGHMKNISAKLGARHRAEAVALAYRRGVIGL